MPFDLQLVEARLALHMVGPDEMPPIAWAALEAGFDGPSIRRVAALHNPSGWETDQILPAFMSELGMKVISLQEASVRIARQLASRILREGLDPLLYLRDFKVLWIRADYPKLIQEAGSLEDQQYVFEYAGESEVKFREYVQTVLRELADTADPKPEQ